MICVLSCDVGDVRNDLYVTLKQGEFKKGGHKMADKNIEVTLTICNENGEVINVRVVP